MKLKCKNLYWTPRVICNLSILFISPFARDAFHSDLSIYEQIGGFLIHMFPPFILLAALLIAWEWELTGGMVLMMGFPFVLSGVLFVLNHKKSKMRSEA